MEENRNEYAYVLTVGNKVVKPIAIGWWSTKEGMTASKCGMSVSARAFKKTAGVLVYERNKETKEWILCDSCDVTSRVFKPAKVEFDKNTISKKFYREYDNGKYIYVEGDF